LSSSELIPCGIESKESSDIVRETLKTSIPLAACEHCPTKREA